MPPVGSDGWDRVKVWLHRELEEAGLTKAAVKRGVGMDQRTLDKLLDGEGVRRPDRLAAFAEFLGYRKDAFERVRNGEPPTPLTPPSTDDTDLRFRALERRVDRLEAKLEAALVPEDRPAGDR